VCSDTLLGSWDGKFMHGMCGAGGPDQSGGQYAWPEIHRCLASELHNVGGGCGEHWTQGADKGHSMWNKPEPSCHGYAGGMDEHGKQSHHDPLPTHHQC
jgi:hypothetical protein